MIASRLHLVWIATVCGKLKTDFRYSNTLGWNTFPVPTLTEKNKADLTRCAEDILLAREASFPGDHCRPYDPDKMPETCAQRMNAMMKYWSAFILAAALRTTRNGLRCCSTFTTKKGSGNEAIHPAPKSAIDP